MDIIKVYKIFHEYYSFNRPVEKIIIKMRYLLLIFVSVLFVYFTSCDKEKDPPTIVVTPTEDIGAEIGDTVTYNVEIYCDQELNLFKVGTDTKGANGTSPEVMFEPGVYRSSHDYSYVVPLDLEIGDQITLFFEVTDVEDLKESVQRRIIVIPDTTLVPEEK